MHEIVILYHDKKTEKICKDIKKAKQELPAIVAEKLHALINLLESAEKLCDISEIQIYHLAGRRSGYRLVIIPLDADGKEWKEKDINVIYKATEIIIAWEVSNHYE